MNMPKCRRCGADVKIGPHVTNKRFCSRDCYETWWNERRSRRLTRADIAGAALGPPPIVSLSDVQAAWLAALIDGEGTIGIWRERRPKNTSGYRYRAVIQVVNSNRALLDQMLAFVDGFGHQKNLKRTNPLHKPTYGVTVNRRAVRGILEQIKPYLVAKRRQADVVIEFCKVMAAAPTRASRDHDMLEELRLECRALNKRGL